MLCVAVSRSVVPGVAQRGFASPSLLVPPYGADGSVSLRRCPRCTTPFSSQELRGRPRDLATFWMGSSSMSMALDLGIILVPAIFPLVSSSLGLSPSFFLCFFFSYSGTERLHPVVDFRHIPPSGEVCTVMRQLQIQAGHSPDARVDFLAAVALRSAKSLVSYSGWTHAVDYGCLALVCTANAPAADCARAARTQKSAHFP